MPMLVLRTLTVVILFMVLFTVEGNHSSGGGSRQQRRLLDILRYPFRFLKKFKFNFELPFSRFLKQPRDKNKEIKFDDVNSGRSEYFEDGNSRGVVFRSKDGRSRSMSVSSSGGSGFAMAGSWPSGNFVMAQSKGKDRPTQIFAKSGSSFY